MSDSVTTRVEVAVSPEVAFDVFTSEIDAWYRVDTDTLPDITRTAAIRFEPQLGGRLLDVHDLATGAGRELGRITAWEPGRRLAFADNEGTEVEVSFEPRGAGTRVTLTHRNLDRLAPQRAGELRRSGWAALAPFYRDHIAPNARPLALAVTFRALLLLVIGGALGLTVTLTGGWLPSWAAASMTAALVLAATFAVLGTEDRLVRRWLASHWQYERISLRLIGLLLLGLLIKGLYQIMEHGEDVLGAIGLPVVLLLVYWSLEEQGPARGRSLRTRAGSAESASARRHPAARRFLLMVGFVALGAGLLEVLRQVDALAGVLYPAVLSSGGALSLWAIVSRRREKYTLGFDPDLYLAVGRPVSEGDERPELLVHRHTKQPEYSGWYAYASEQDCSGDLVVWRMRDLVDHSPEAARPLREGHGDWRWDRAQRAYRRLEHLSDGPRPA